MPIASNFTSVLSKDWEINFTQCAPNGYLKYTDLCNLLQLTAAAHSEIGGISFTDMQEFNQAWVLSRMRVEISKLPKWRDIVTVKTWINSLENSRSVRALEMYVNGKKIVGSETFWAVFNTKTRRPEALALPYEHFELYPENKATEKPFSKITISNEKEVCVCVRMLGKNQTLIVFAANTFFRFFLWLLLLCTSIINLLNEIKKWCRIDSVFYFFCHQKKIKRAIRGGKLLGSFRIKIQNINNNNDGNVN
jgi:acyl-CoA thioesterase FadM